MSRAQRWPHSPIEPTTPRSARPAAVRQYSDPAPDPGRRSSTPAYSRVDSRCLRSVADRRGTPRRISLKRRAPASNSRTTSSVQRSASSSDARATGQNCPYSCGIWTPRVDHAATGAGGQAARSRFRTCAAAVCCADSPPGADLQSARRATPCRAPARIHPSPAGRCSPVWASRRCIRAWPRRAPRPALSPPGSSGREAAPLGARAGSTSNACSRTAGSPARAAIRRRRYTKFSRARLPIPARCSRAWRARQGRHQHAVPLARAHHPQHRLVAADGVAAARAPHVERGRHLRRARRQHLLAAAGRAVAEAQAAAVSAGEPVSLADRRDPLGRESDREAHRRHSCLRRRLLRDARSEWDPETLAERRWNIQEAMQIFKESNERFAAWKGSPGCA